MSRWAWQSVAIYLAALIVVASALSDTPWGKHWVFVSVYVVTFVIAVASGLKLTSLMIGSLIWLRYNLAEGIGGWPLKLSSALFAVLLFALVIHIAGAKRDQKSMG